MLAALLYLATTYQDDPPRLRTLCPNGAVVLAEKMAKEPAISIQLWASSRTVPETPATHGWRHLLEHLVAPGQNGDLDRRLERAGGYLRARTFRDAMQFEVTVPHNQISLGLSAITELLKPLSVDQAQIDRELQTMREEYATYDDASRLASASWSTAYGEQGLDAFGDFETMKRASPDALRSIQRRQFYPENLVLVIAGPIDVKEATAAAVSVVGIQQGATSGAQRPPLVGHSGRVEIDGFGESRAAIVAGFDKPSTLGALAFALAVASEFEGSFVTYTPTETPGLVIVGQTEKQAGVGLRIDALTEGDLPLLYARGRVLARSWVERYLRTASGVGYLRGLLLIAGKGSRPETMLDGVDGLSYQEFKTASGLFSKDKAVTAVGR
jgi:predicted Zn-dependent peptidase